MRNIYDAIIIGCGTSGLFAAMQLALNNKTVLIIEKGNMIDKRHCPIIEGKVDKCVKCKLCSITTGCGGAGTFSDFKMNINSEYGGNLTDYISEKELNKYIKTIDDIYLKYGVTKEVIEPEENIFNKLKEKSVKNNIDLIKSKIRHIGTDNAPIVMGKIIKDIINTGNCDIITNYEINNNNLYKDIIGNYIVKYKTNEPDVEELYFRTKNLIVATGREGAQTTVDIAKKFNIKTIPATVDIGIRFETNKEITKEFTDALYDFKFIYTTPTFNDKVRSFCVNPGGFVATENNKNVLTVNGYSNKKLKSENTNFAILVSINFTEPFNNPNDYGMYIANLGNMLSGGVMVQTLGDLKRGRRTTENRLHKSIVKPTLDATTGDLSFVLPYRHLTDIKEFIEALDKIMPGMNNDSNLLYGVEVKFYSNKVVVNKDMMSLEKGLYFIGDGAGVSRSICQASISGLIAANNILKGE